MLTAEAKKITQSVCLEPVLMCYKDVSRKLKAKLQKKLSLDCSTCYCSSELCSTLATCFICQICTANTDSTLHLMARFLVLL